MEKKQLTFGIPMYNAESYIEELLDCFDDCVDLNYEILIVNDGSTDNSELKVKQHKNKRIRLISQKNMGVSEARSNIIKNAYGEWLTFVDSDDLIDFKKYLDVFIKVKDTRYDYVICVDNQIDYKNILNSKDPVAYLIEKQIINSPCQKFFKVDKLNDNKIYFDKNVSIGEDALFNFNYLYYCENVHYIRAFDLYKYRKVNSNSLMKKYRDNRFEELMYVNEHSLKYVKSLSQRKAFELIRVLNCRGCLNEMMKYPNVFNTFKLKYDYLKKLRGYKKMQYLYLNGFIQTFKYYTWYFTPKIILLILLPLFFKKNR